MMVQMDEGLWNALLELDTLMQEKKSLASQLEELTLSRYDLLLLAVCGFINVIAPK